MSEKKKPTIIGYRPTKEQISVDKKAFKDRKPATQKGKALDKGAQAAVDNAPEEGAKE